MRNVKRAHATATNIEHFLATIGIERAGLFTVTFGREVRDHREAQRRVHSFAVRVLSSCFGEFIRVREFHLDGRPHFHFCVECAEDIRSGFNFEHYLAVQAWNRHRRQGEKPRGSLGRNAHLRQLHETLNAAAGAYGIGRMELVPIRTVGEALGKYLGGYLSKSIANQPASAKRTRHVTYSRGCPRVVKGQFAWIEGGWLWRQHLAAFARRVGAESMGDLRERYGRRWAYRLREAIMAVPLEAAVYPNVRQAAQDGRDVHGLPEDATNIVYTS